MKILFCTHDFDSGGSARSLSILLRHMAKSHEIILLSLQSPTPGKGMLEYYQNLGVQVYFVQWGWLPVSYINCPVNLEASRQIMANSRQYIPELKNLAKDCDLICFNSYPATSLATVFPRSIPKRLIARDVFVESCPGYAQATKLIKSYITRAVAIGPVESRQLKKIGIEHEIIYNTGPVSPEYAPYPQGPIRFATFTQFTPSKGVDILVLAGQQIASILRKAGASIHIYGGRFFSSPKSLEGQLLLYVQNNNLEDVIVFEGWVSDVETEMKKAHCIVRPDKTGSPWGRDVIEAMSIGRPVISTGTEDVFIKNGQTGWLVPANDAAALGKILATMCNSQKLLEKMGKDAFAFAKENFDPNINAGKVESYLTENV